MKKAFIDFAHSSEAHAICGDDTVPEDRGEVNNTVPPISRQTSARLVTRYRCEPRTFNVRTDIRRTHPRFPCGLHVWPKF
eukprot:793927-Pyramimonas_sp.AAC.1